MELSFIHNFLINEGFILTKTKELNNNVSNYRKEQDASIFRIGFIIKEEDGKNLSEYQIITELPLETSNGFMKADIVLILKNDRGVIQDAIIIENKLSQSTAFTARQKEGFGAILQNGQHTMNVKYSRPNLDPKVKNLTISKDNIYRIYDHGKDNINNVNIEKITKIR